MAINLRVGENGRSWMEEREVESEVILFQLKPYIVKNVGRVVFLCMYMWRIHFLTSRSFSGLPTFFFFLAYSFMLMSSASLNL